MGSISSITPLDGVERDIRAVGIPYGQCDSTSTSTAFTATVPGIKSLHNGVCALIKNGVVTSASGCTLNINGLGAKPIYSSMSAATALTTAFAVNYTMLFVYDETRVSGGCWLAYYGYYTSPSPSDSTPQSLGTASAGVSDDYSRADHVHAKPTYTASEVGAYELPSGGIPKTDLASGVQDSLDAADSAYQKPSGGIPASDLASGVIPSVPTKVSDLQNDSGFITGMEILSYGSSTWADFLAAYNAKKVVYCRASSNSNPATGSQTRLAFMAYVNNASNPTSVEFQYYRSVSSHSDAQQGDQVYVYKLESNGAWSVTVREAYSQIAVGSGLSKSYSNGVLTLSLDLTTWQGGSY